MVDFITDSNGDRLIINNDFVIGDAFAQHIYDMLTASKGDYKFNPAIGCNINEWLNSPIDIQQKKDIIIKNAIIIGYKLRDVEIVEDASGALQINPIL